MTLKSILAKLDLPAPLRPGEEVTEVAAPPKRLIAFLIDYAVIMLLLMNLRPLFLPDGWDEMSFDQSIWYLFPVVFVGFIGFVLKDIFGGISLGKAFFNLKIRILDQDFSTPDIKVLIIRNLFYLILPVELFTLLKDPYCRRLGDRYLNTVVLISLKPPTVRQLTHRVLATLSVIAFAWLLWVFTTPIGIKKSTAYKIAKTSLLKSSDINQQIGEIESFGYWPDVNYSKDQIVYRIRVSTTDQPENENPKIIQIVLEKSGSTLKTTSIMILADESE